MRSSYNLVFCRVSIKFKAISPSSCLENTATTDLWGIEDRCRGTTGVPGTAAPGASESSALLYIIPIGRHSFHGDFGLDGVTGKDAAEVGYFVQRWATISEKIKQLDRFARLVVADNLTRLGLEGGNKDLGLREYFRGLIQTPVDKKAAFLRLWKFFEADQ